ncbi:MAG: DUF4199 domain-containing protein [Muribaculaceae bacterium]|nr:DUF4199 domain-containing protein [Muribaculaceae bacterium]
MEKKSIYKYASETGVPMGLYLTLMSGCLLMSVKFQFLLMLLMPLSIGFPFVLWWQMKRILREESSYNKFSSLWLGGIYTVIFGTLICMFLSAIYVVFVEPNFVGLYFTQAIEAVESSPLAGEYEATVELMRNAMEAHILPSGLEFLTTMGWLTCFTGCILSLFIALLMNRGNKSVTRQFPI